MAASEKEISRVTRSRQEARANYDRISGWYDLIEGVWEQALREEALGRLGVREGETALEIGFGPGHDLISMARSVGASGRVYGIDLSRGMLAVAITRVHKAGLLDRVDLECGDATNLPYKGDFFDAIFLSFTLELFDTPEIPVVLGECRRVLRKGGRMGVVSLSRSGGENLMARLYEWGHARFPQLLDCRPIFVQQALEQASFEISEAHRKLLFGLPVEIVIARKPD
jgi:demethylmenaquinone methyltransferase/2-methoxy-6-polyprenyl-1,4-benzoquinol methylase